MEKTGCRLVCGADEHARLVQAHKVRQRPSCADLFNQHDAPVSRPTNEPYLSCRHNVIMPVRFP
jgi:hypothetical protein